MAYKGGKERRINTYATGNQSYPEVTGLDDGGWLVSWSSYGQDGSSNGIYQQRFSAGGAKIGTGESKVPTTVTGVQDVSDVAALDDGGWVVTWSSRPFIDAAGFEIRLQAYNADGSTQGIEMQANTTTLNEQSRSNVIGLDNGGWVVAWQSQNGNGVFDVYQQAYNSSGAKVGGETLVNTVTSSDQFDPAITALDNGRWVVTWASYGHASDFSGIYQQVYNANGTKSGTEVHVNTYTTNNQYDPEVTTLGNGDFVVTWESQGQDGNGFGIYQQRFNDNGTKDGVETRVNTITAKDQTHADVTALSTGGYVVAWESVGKANAAGDIHAQVFNASGKRVGKELLVNVQTNSEQLDPSVAALDNGRFVVTWQSYAKDGDQGAICQRVFTDKGQKMADEKLTLDLRPIIEGNGRDNTLIGKDIGEKFFGRGGDDTINAKGGNDLLDGGKGRDLLIGGDGKDVFVFRTGYGNDTIRGFFEGDRVDLSKLGSVADFDDLTENHMTQVGGDVLIDGLNGDHIWIRHALGGQLTQGDFIFD